LSIEDSSMSIGDWLLSIEDSSMSVRNSLMKLRTSLTHSPFPISMKGAQ
jgi:hypothetical protein